MGISSSLDNSAEAYKPDVVGATYGINSPSTGYTVGQISNIHSRVLHEVSPRHGSACEDCERSLQSEQGGDKENAGRTRILGNLIRG